MNVTKRTISAELAKINLALNARRSTEELKLLTNIWWVDCQHMLEHRFVQAVGACRKASKWFPTPADVNEQYDQIVRNIPEPDLPQIDSASLLSPEEESERIKKLREMMRPDEEPTMYINAKYKPDNPMGKNIVYIPDPFQENKRRYLAGKEFKTSV